LAHVFPFCGGGVKLAARNPFFAATKAARACDFDVGRCGDGRTARAHFDFRPEHGLHRGGLSSREVGGSIPNQQRGIISAACLRLLSTLMHRHFVEAATAARSAANAALGWATRAGLARAGDGEGRRWFVRKLDVHGEGM